MTIETPIQPTFHGTWRTVLGRSALVVGLLQALPDPSFVMGPEPDAAATAGAGYPELPDLRGPDISGEPGVTIVLDEEDGVLVDLDDALYSLEGRPLELGFGDLDQITLLIELPDHPAGATLFVGDENGWTTIELDTGDYTHTLERGDTGPLWFELAGPNQEGPVFPTIIVKPVEDDPEPT